MATAQLSSIPALYGNRPYITSAEYRLAPTGVDVSNLVKGNPSGTDAMLSDIISRASSWADVICGQSLTARTDTFQGRYSVDRDGNMTVFPRFFPLIEVTAFAYGSQVNNLTALSDLSQIWVEEMEFQVSMGYGTWSSSGPLQFGQGPRPGAKMRALYSYIAGFPHTVLTTPATAGQTSIVLADTTGILPGKTQMTIFDGAQTETVSVSSGYTPGVSTVTLASGLLYPHAQTGISVSALPPFVKQAVILLTSTLIQTRGAVALIAPAVSGLTSRYTQSGSQLARAQRVPADDNVSIACDLLTPLRRIR
jgi:hypothetical protein